MNARRGAAAAAALTLAGALALCPVPALAQASDTGTTEVTVVAGPGWGQKKGGGARTEGNRTGGSMPQTGDPSAWIPFLAVGAAACTAGLAATSRTGREDADEDKR